MSDIAHLLDAISRLQDLLDAATPRAEQAEAEVERLTEASNEAWAKHGGMEIAKGQWQARAEQAERERDDLRAELLPTQFRLLRAEEAERELVCATTLADQWEHDAKFYKARIAELTRALEPIAEVGASKLYAQRKDDEHTLIAMRDLRAAARALAKDGE